MSEASKPITNRGSIRCRLFGHRWHNASLSCLRCKRTHEEIKQRPATWEDVSEAYWRGVEHGRKLDRTRAYRLGRVRGMDTVIEAVKSGL